MNFSDYFLIMEKFKYPMIESFLAGPTPVYSWTVDDVVRSLKKIEDGLRKLEVNSAKDTSWQNQSERTRQTKELQTQFKKLTEQLNRLLGVSI